jgi:hypothetical protein
MGQFLLRSIQNWPQNLVVAPSKLPQLNALCENCQVQTDGAKSSTQFPDYFPIGCIKFLGPW